MSWTTRQTWLSPPWVDEVIQNYKETKPMADDEQTNKPTTERGRSIHLQNVKAQGKIPWYAEPGGPSPSTALKIEFNITLEDYLLLTGSRVAGYDITITPLKQPIPRDDEGFAQWEIPGLNVDDVDDNHEHTFVDQLCTCGQWEPIPEGHSRHRFVDGRCECGQVHPTHTFNDGVCVCGAEEAPDDQPTT